MFPKIQGKYDMQRSKVHSSIGIRPNVSTLIIHVTFKFYLNGMNLLSLETLL